MTTTNNENEYVIITNAERRLNIIRRAVKVAAEKYHQERGWKVPEVLQDAVYNIIVKGINEEPFKKMPEFVEFVAEKAPFVLRNVVAMATF